ncbi:DUF1217 domain-containing protein [Rhizobiaceae bacterium n13]|uniref:DUF1217 domain-containing protein n=1 Tax=Ferirhizobium litorale TaxID=2927786 RepID=A0AAE3U1F7_9HYPH|nr:DUF1217 domain-containing protein [Fererhizobium litorale]MDI7863392.1 DUF1217 domain-containing protein [Fererhizobium litorale]MDI7922331.1 DUF1217 domain-containing protein [Fererhizobium litorale]
MTTTYTSYRLISQDISKSLDRVAGKPDVARETEYYLANIGSIKSINDFMADSRIYNYALKAHGLEDMAYAKAFIRKVLTEGVANEEAFANKLADGRYAELAKTFDFAMFGQATTSFDKAQRGVVDNYLRQTLEQDAGDDNAGVRLALYFERKASTITSGMSVLADDALAAVVRVALGIPEEVAASDVDKQAAFIEKSIDVEDFQDPEKVGLFLERFTAMWELHNPSDNYDPLAVFGSSAGHGISPDLLLSINSLKLGGR